MEEEEEEEEDPGGWGRRGSNKQRTVSVDEELRIGIFLFRLVLQHCSLRFRLVLEPCSPRFHALTHILPGFPIHKRNGKPKKHPVHHYAALLQRGWVRPAGRTRTPHTHTQQVQTKHTRVTCPLVKLACSSGERDKGLALQSQMGPPFPLEGVDRGPIRILEHIQRGDGSVWSVLRARLAHFSTW